MAIHRRPFRRRLMSGAAPFALAIVAGLALVPTARADDSDPPSRVGHITVLQGTVSFHPSPDDQWSPAEVNYPIAQSTALWVDEGGQAEIQIGEARLKLDSGTELDIVQLDDNNVILSVPQGRVDVALHGRADNERYDIQTPRGDVDLLADGDYRVFAGTDTDPSRIASFNGQAQLADTASQITVERNQEIVATAGTPVSFSVNPCEWDAFDKAFFDHAAQVFARPVPSYVPEIPGVAALSEYGAWQNDGHYGHVWYPSHIDADWQPYHRGHWAHIAPWGYTWIDDAPWGFAPFHYGRWVQVGPRWGWVATEPGVVIEPHFHPVYAPAMVTFIGNPDALTVGLNVGGVGIGIGIGGGGGGAVGWVPLGPGEPFHPWYPVSDGYLRQANIVNVNRTTIENIHNTTVINNTTYINQRAATVVPQTAFAGGRPIQQAAYHIPPAALARPIEPARPQNIEKILPPPVVRPGAAVAKLPPAPKLVMAHPPAASAAAFRAHPPALAATPSAVPKAGSNAVPKGTVIPPPVKPLAHPQAEPGRPGEPAKPLAGPTGPKVEPPKPGEPARPAAEPAHPGVPHPVEPTKPGEPARPAAEPTRPGVPHPTAEPPKPGEPTRPAAEPAHPGVPHPVEPTKPGEPARPAAEPAHPGVPHPTAEPPKPGEPARPAAEPAHPGVPHPTAEPPKPAEARPAAEPAKPVPHPAAEAPKPARPAEEPARPAPHPAAEAPKPAPHPAAEPPKPAPHPAAEAPKPAPHPAAEPPKPAPHPPAAPAQKPAPADEKKKTDKNDPNH